MKNRKTLIIAEAGVNHNGSFELAKKMVDVAKESGADVIKFQTGIAENLISKFAPKAAYQKEATGEAENQLEMVKELLLPLQDFERLKEYCDKVGIQFLSTPFDLESIDYLNDIGVEYWKIPSGEITNLPYLIQIAKTKKNVIMSTGMCEMYEIQQAIKVLRENGCGDISLLHCTTEYPAPFEEVNLRAMEILRKKFQVRVGYSDHTKGIEIPFAAVAMGAEIIEKHFTLDKTMEGPDHKASLEPKELEQMVTGIRNIELAMGKAEKTVTSSEQKNLKIVRKSIVAKRAIQKGEELTPENITTKRPGDGVTPMKWFEVLGTKAIRNFEEDELIEL